MTTSISQRYWMLRGSNSFLNYLHLDALATGLIVALLVVAGVAGNVNGISMNAISRGFSPSTELSTLPPAVAPARTALTPGMTAVLDHVALRYRVAPDALQPVFEAAQSAARERRLDPLLIIAVIGVESGFNPFSQSTMGAQGLMQVIPRYHLDKVPGAAIARPFLDPVSNVQIGAQVLQEAIRRQGGLIEGLQYYAGAADDDQQGYANKVLAEKSRLEQAARRRAPPEERRAEPL